MKFYKRKIFNYTNAVCKKLYSCTIILKIVAVIINR